MWWIRARGVRLWSLTACSEASSTALAPSEIWLATAAVIRPPSLSGGQAGHLLQRCLPRGLVDGEVRPPATISLSKWPARIASNARWWLASAKRSMSSREMSHFSAIISAPRNCEISWSP